nr:uncharacterized protein LOC112010701 [Quercus suber]
MAEDVINGLENMRLTMEEEELITISDEGRKEEIESYSLSLLGKFLTCLNLFQFKFRREFDMDRVLKGGPWSFDNQVLLLRRWQPGMTALNIKFDSVALWVQIWGAPFDMSSPKVAFEIGSRLGEMVEVEKRKNLDAQNLFIRVKVAVPTSKPL